MPNSKIKKRQKILFIQLEPIVFMIPNTRLHQLTIVQLNLDCVCLGLTLINKIVNIF